MHQRKSIESSIASNPIASGWRPSLYTEMRASGDVRMTLNEKYDCLLPALNIAGNIRVHGTAGDYAFAYNDGAQVILVGNAGFATGLGMRSGILRVRGQVGDMVAAYGEGGSILVEGNAGEDSAAVLRGADLSIAGNAGNRAGYKMQAGSLVIQGDCGEDLGAGLTGGVIYLAGQAASVSKSIRETRMKEPDRFRLSLILARTNLVLSPKDFRVYKPD